MMEHESNVNPTLSKSTGLSRKLFYRAWTHSNPLNDSYFPVPTTPSQVDYPSNCPGIFSLSVHVDSARKIEFADIGCGFGGLLISLSPLFPDNLMTGMELSDMVTEYVMLVILAITRIFQCFRLI